MLCNWADQILGYDMTVVDRPGVTMILEDAHSRLYFGIQEEEPEILSTNVGPAQELKDFINECLNKTCPPEDERATLVDRCHLEAGHLGAKKMFKKLFRDGWYWNGMLRECKGRVDSCTECLQYNTKHEGYHPLQPLSSHFPMERVHADLA